MQGHARALAEASCDSRETSRELSRKWNVTREINRIGRRETCAHTSNSSVAVLFNIGSPNFDVDSVHWDGSRKSQNHDRCQYSSASQSALLPAARLKREAQGCEIAANKHAGVCSQQAIGAIDRIGVT
jgi:hypothetical protein